MVWSVGLPLLAVTAVAGAVLVHRGRMEFYFRLACRRNRGWLFRVEHRLMEPKREDGRVAERRREGVEWVRGIRAQEVEIRGRDGKRLRGHLIERKDAERSVIFFHGWRSGWDRDGGAFAKALYEGRCNVLLVDQRAHGESEGEFIGYGVLEKYDCVEWTGYMAEVFGRLPIYLAGVSMGAATVLMAAGLTLDAHVRGIIADCAYTSPFAMVRLFARKFAHVKGLRPVEELNGMLQRRAGYDLKEETTLAAMERCEVPVLFFHGTEDGFVPPEMTRENYERCRAPKRLVLVGNAAHARSFLEDPGRYMEEIRRFFQWKEEKEDDFSRGMRKCNEGGGEIVAETKNI